MTKAPAEHLGLLPSLEVLPFFAGDGLAKPGGCKFPFQPKAYSSYGEIARNMLTRELMGGIIPWEIFITDVLALPGQKTSWKVPVFIQACPTELVLREAVFKAFYPPKSKPGAKLPTRLTFGVESQNSLTKLQAHDWLGYWKAARNVELTFKMLPVEMMIQALKAEALDAIIVATPWGMIAEANGIGIRDPRFIPGKYAQQVVLACHRDFAERHPDLAPSLSHLLAASRASLRDPAGFSKAAGLLSKCSHASVLPPILEQAARLYSFADFKEDIVADESKLIAELAALERFSALPSQVSANGQTARLFLPELLE